MGHVEHSITHRPATKSSIADVTNTAFSNADLWFAMHTGSGNLIKGNWYPLVMIPSTKDEGSSSVSQKFEWSFKRP